MKRWTPPPGWPPPPHPGWTPPAGWTPDPSWPAPPSDWQWWQDIAQPGFGGWVAQHKALTVIGGVVALLVVLVAIGDAVGNPSPSKPVADNPIASTTTTPPSSTPSTRTTTAAPPTSSAPTASAPPRSPYPPRSVDDLKALGFEANQNYQVVSVENIGIAGCAGQRVVIVLHSHNARYIVDQLAAAWANQLGYARNTGVVFAYYTLAQAQHSFGYTAGRLIVDSPCTGYQTPQIEVDNGSSIAGTTVAVITH